jgi:hypothetical protein
LGLIGSRWIFAHLFFKKNPFSKFMIAWQLARVRGHVRSSTNTPWLLRLEKHNAFSSSSDDDFLKSPLLTAL